MHKNTGGHFKHEVLFLYRLQSQRLGFFWISEVGLFTGAYAADNVHVALKQRVHKALVFCLCPLPISHSAIGIVGNILAAADAFPFVRHTVDYQNFDAGVLKFQYGIYVSLWAERCV